MSRWLRFRPTWIGLLLLAGLFLLSAIRIATYTRRDDTRTVIRIAHVHLESGAREAFAAIVADYMQLHPGVVIEQIPVPQKLYPIWIRTRLIGGTAPDLVELFGVEENLLPRHFVALGEAVRRPNPYNTGGPLAGLAWRDTFVDGLSGLPSYYFNLLDNYGIPLATTTARLFYNKSLLRHLTGLDRPPEDFAGFVAACEHIAGDPEARAAGIVPIAGSQLNADYLLNNLFSSQTQRLAIAAEPTRRILSPGHDWQAAFVNGKWDLDTPDIRNALGLLREIGRFFPPGFTQLQTDDALFAFTQGRAVMIAATSSDARGIRSQSGFPVGVLPLPAPVNPRYALGPNIEGVGSSSPATFAVSRLGHSEVALDFLRFLTSHTQAGRFSRLVSWPSAIRGVEPDADTAPFQPRLDGYPPGLTLNFSTGGSRLYKQNLHRLTSPGGSVEAFVDALREPYAVAVRADLARANHQILSNCCLLDSALGSSWDFDPDPADAAAFDRLSAVSESQTLQEEASYRREYTAPVSQP